MKLATSLERLGTESAFSVLAEAKKLEAQGKPMIHLGLGQPDFKTPKHVVDAAKKTKLSVPLVVRLAGTNFKEGKEILDKSGLQILSASDLNDAAKKIVEAIK